MPTTMRMTTSCPPVVDLANVRWNQAIPIHPARTQIDKKLELPMLKLHPPPKKADDLADFQFGIKTNIMLASGRHHRRLPWIIASTCAKDPGELSRVPRELLTSDLKLSVACVVVCCNRNQLTEILRQAGGGSNNGSDMRNGCRRLWCIYKFFSSPNAGGADQGLRVTCLVLDFPFVKLYGGDEGLGKFWTKWTKTIFGVANGGGHRSVFEHLFVNQMRNAPPMTACVLDYDEADPEDEKHTWEWLLKKGRASFQHERERERERQSSAASIGATGVTSHSGMGPCCASLGCGAASLGG
jgi:hypothetical protein